LGEWSVSEREQFPLLFQILRRFQQADVLDGIILIGSWCLYFYRIEPWAF
jgi:hypothetical protein